MSTLAIHPKRVQLYRVLWDRWIIVLRILFDLGAGAHPVKWRAVADTLLVDKKTCQKYIAGLVRDGHLVAAGEGFMLTQAGMDVLLENERGEFLPTSGEFLPRNNSPLLKESVVVDSELKPMPTTSTTQLGKNPGEIFSPDVQLALEQISLLFDGSEISLKGLPYYLHIEKVLGWIAYVYDKRTSFARPCGMIYSKLNDKSAPSPSMRYMKSPETFLPDEYLIAIGRPPSAQMEIETRDEYIDHRPRRDETITEAILQRFETAMCTWEERLGKSKGPETGLFQSWVKGCWPVHFENNILLLGVHNDPTREHCQRHAASILGGLLEWSFEFVVAVETEE